MGAQLHLTEADLPGYLRGIGLFEDFEEIRVEKAGDGNINWVRRASSPAGRSYIIKQARPALERFPEYRVSTERLVFEARWLERAREHDDDGVCPAVHGFDEANRVLVLEDLGEAERLDHALAHGADASAAARVLAAFLGRVHRATRGEALAPCFRNGAMRRLHGDHIFALPLQANAFPLPPATRARADALAADAELGRIAAAAYRRYLEPRGALVHGDVQAGNVLLAPRGPKLLDAEIAHVGDPAFDVGTLLAHLALPALAEGRPERPRPTLLATWDAYREAHGPTGLAYFSDVVRYAGLELLRRTIGAARVASVESDDAGGRVLDTALRWICTPAERPEALAP